MQPKTGKQLNSKTVNPPRAALLFMLTVTKKKAHDISLAGLFLARMRQRLRLLASTYHEWNITRPLFTKGMTCGGLLGSGDVLCQTLQGRQQWQQRNQRAPSFPDLDWQRVGRMFWWGTLFNGPAGHWWYWGLDRAVKMSGTRGIVAN